MDAKAIAKIIDDNALFAAKRSITIEHHNAVNAAMWLLAMKMGLREEVVAVLQELVAADRGAQRPLHLRPNAPRGA